MMYQMLRCDLLSILYCIWSPLSSIYREFLSLYSHNQDTVGPPPAHDPSYNVFHMSPLLSMYYFLVLIFFHLLIQWFVSPILVISPYFYRPYLYMQKYIWNILSALTSLKWRTFSFHLLSAPTSNSTSSAPTSVYRNIFLRMQVERTIW